MAEAADLWPHAQIYVGNVGADYHMCGILQLELLKQNGLRPYHHVLEIGCGALVAGRPLIQFLDPDRYVGIEPNTWLIEAARNHFPDMEDWFLTKRPVFLARSDFDATDTQRQFDFVLSHSILSHAAHWQLPLFLAANARNLAPHGISLASIRFQDANGRMMGDSRHEEWQYPGVTYFSPETVEKIAAEHGLVAQHRPDYRDFVIRHSPINYHDWVRIRHRCVPTVRRRTATLDDKNDPSCLETNAQG